jgi:hypothetical protein
MHDMAMKAKKKALEELIKKMRLLEDKSPDPDKAEEGLEELAEDEGADEVNPMDLAKKMMMDEEEPDEKAQRSAFFKGGKKPDAGKTKAIIMSMSIKADPKHGKLGKKY